MKTTAKNATCPCQALPLYKTDCPRAKHAADKRPNQPQPTPRRKKKRKNRGRHETKHIDWEDRIWDFFCVDRSGAAYSKTKHHFVCCFGDNDDDASLCLCLLPISVSTSLFLLIPSRNVTPNIKQTNQHERTNKTKKQKKKHTVRTHLLLASIMYSLSPRPSPNPPNYNISPHSLLPFFLIIQVLQQ